MILSKSFQSRIPSPNSVLKGSGDEIVVLVQGDGGSGVIDIGNGVCIGNPTSKFVAPIRPRHQIDRCSRSIAKKPLAGGGYCAACAAADSNGVLSSKTSLTACHPYN